MQLVDEGRLNLDQSIATYLPKPLPEFEKYADLRNDERWRKFTLRILLDHTSGIPNWRFGNADGKLDIKFEPGSRYSYCGEGINLAQLVVEQALHQEVGALLQERIFTPLGMQDTGLVWREAFAANLAVGHDEKGVNLGHKQRGSVRAAGSMDTTIADFSKYLSALMQGRVLGPKALAEMTRPQIKIHSLFQFPVAAGPHAPPDTDENRAVGVAYGLGWAVLQHTPYGPAYLKEGHDDGWGNYAIGFPAKDTAIVLLSNSSNGEHVFRELLAKLIGDTFTPWKWERYVPFDQPGDAGSTSFVIGGRFRAAPSKGQMRQAREGPVCSQIAWAEPKGRSAARKIKGAGIFSDPFLVNTPPGAGSGELNSIDAPCCIRNCAHA